MRATRNRHAKIVYWALLLLLAFTAPSPSFSAKESSGGGPVVYVVPVREDIMPPLVYLIRRGVKDAMKAKAEVLILDMDTNGGRVDTTEEIIEIISQFKGTTVTFVNRKAYSAGAFISFATQKIFMAPQSVIGAAAPIMMSPGGTGASEMPDTMEVKATSAVSALVRAHAEKNGHNPEVADAMVKKSRELKIGDTVLNQKGEILTLTNVEAEREYDDKKLLSAGTVSSIKEITKTLGLISPKVVTVAPSGTEKLGIWLNAISPILLMIGIVGIYIEFKTPGFGLPGIVGTCAFLLYFLGGYVAGLSGFEWVAIFVLGLILLGVEFLVFPGLFVFGLFGALLILTALIMAMVDKYPGGPVFPTLPQLTLPLTDLSLGVLGAIIVATLLIRFLPKGPMGKLLVSQTASGVLTTMQIDQAQQLQKGLTGVAISTLRPGGKAQFGDAILDVRSQGELIEKGQQVRIIRHSGSEPVVEQVG